MSPYEINILVHYYGCADDHPQISDPPPIWWETIDYFQSNGLLDNNPNKHARYQITERGKVLVKAMCELPLPVWKMP